MKNGKMPPGVWPWHIWGKMIKENIMRWWPGAYLAPGHLLMSWWQYVKPGGNSFVIIKSSQQSKINIETVSLELIGYYNSIQFHLSYKFLKYLLISVLCIEIVIFSVWWTFRLIAAWWRNMATQIWVNIDSGDGLLPDGIIWVSFKSRLMNFCSIYL